MARLPLLGAAVAGALAWSAGARRMPRASGLPPPREDATLTASDQRGASLLEAESGFPQQWLLPFVGPSALRSPRPLQPQAFPQAESIASFGADSPRQTGLSLRAAAPPSNGGGAGGGGGGGDGGGGEPHESAEENEAPTVQEPVLSTVSATRKSGKVGSLPLPADWAGLIQRGTVQEVEGLFWKQQGVQVFLASLESDPDRKVTIKIAPADNAALGREANLMERLKMLETLGVEDFGNVVAFYESSLFLNMRAVIEETIEEDLNSLLKDFTSAPLMSRRKQLFGWVRRLVPRRRRTAMPLRRSVPIVIDLLRGALALEHAGLIHQDLTPASVLLTKDGRAVITDLSGACLEHCDLRDALACGSPFDVPVGNRSLDSVLYQPPESARGHELSPSAHTWYIGLIFARMCFGYTPTFLTVARRALLEGSPFEKKRPSNEAIVDTIQSSFSIGKDPSFSKQAAEVRDLLAAMLRPQHTRRISTSEALGRFEAFAGRLGVAVPERRVHPRMSLRWPVPPSLEEEMERIGRIDEHSQGIAPEGALDSPGAAARGARDAARVEDSEPWQ